MIKTKGYYQRLLQQMYLQHLITRRFFEESVSQNNQDKRCHGRIKGVIVHLEERTTTNG